MSQQIWLNGTLVPRQQATVSVYDHGLLYGDGVFEGIRAYNGRVFKMATHLKRLDDSARAIRLAMPYSSDDLAAGIRQTLDANDRKDAYIRLCVTRGVGALGLHPFQCKDSTVFIIVDSIALYPPQMYDSGMAIITASTLRNHPAALSPRIKSMNYLNNILAKIEAIDAGVAEAVMLNSQGYVTECTGDNIFLVRRGPRDGRPVLHTPPLHAGVLEGITMNTVIGLASQAGIPVERNDLTKHDLYTAEELFLTGTAAEVVPVTKIDSRTIGDGAPGAVTRRLKDAFHALVAHDAPED
ncbi:MAG: branched-chain-amino-acid transaminase [Phycisphaeraceae bacterium]